MTAAPLADGEDEEDDIDMSSDEAEEHVHGENCSHGPEEKRPRLSKEEKAALHAAQPHRVTLLPSHALLQELIPLWEPARRADTSKEERRAAIEALWAAVKGRVGEVSRGHKGGRILQTVSV